jgi:hypothetical protein
MNSTLRWAVIVACGLLASCSSDSTNPPPGVASAGSAFVDGTYFAELRFFQESCRAASVTATGPGESGAVTADLTCSSGGEWQARVLLGPTHPETRTEYVFTIEDGGRIVEQTAAIPCWLESLPTAVAPSGTRSSPVTFEWMFLPATGIEYTVFATRASNGSVTRSSVVDQNSTTMVLSPGTYTWFVDAIAVGGHEPGSTEACSARAQGASFTVQ